MQKKNHDAAAPWFFYARKEEMDMKKRCPCGSRGGYGREIYCTRCGVPLERKKVYIAGRITGDPDYRQKFEAAANRLTDTGHIPLNPANLPEGLSRADYMRICTAMLETADEVLFLPDWQDSRGASLEMQWCLYIGKPFHCGEW